MTQRIPKIIHTAWLGKKPLPGEYYDYIFNWVMLHPMWELKVWTDETVEKEPLINQALYDQAIVMAQKADILRYEVVYRYGGIWLDTDVEVIKSFDSLLDEEFFAGYEDHQYICPTVFGASKESRVTKKLVYDLPENMKKYGFPEINDYRDCVGLEQSATRYFTRELDKVSGITLLPPQYFYPYGWWELDHADRRFPETICVHHWAASWRK